MQEAVSNLFSVRKCNYRKKTSRKLKRPHGYMSPFPIHILFFQSKSVIIQKKTSKAQKSPWIQEAVSNTYLFFSVRKCNYTKKNEKTQYSPWIQEAVSNTYPFFQSESVIIRKKSEKLKSPHGHRRRFPMNIPFLSQKV